MKKTFGVLLIASLFLNSCGKNETTGCLPVPVANEKQEMINFCLANSINYTQDNSGLLYEIITPGTGITPTASSTISATYVGQLFSGTIFDQSSSPVSFSLSGVIDGWKIGIPLVKKGGRIKLVIPSALAYSCTGAGNTIPPNTPLYFDITLTDVK